MSWIWYSKCFLISRIYHQIIQIFSELVFVCLIYGSGMSMLRLTHRNILHSLTQPLQPNFQAMAGLKRMWCSILLILLALMVNQSSSACCAAGLARRGQIWNVTWFCLTPSLPMTAANTAAKFSNTNIILTVISVVVNVFQWIFNPNNLAFRIVRYLATSPA